MRNTLLFPIVPILALAVLPFETKPTRSQAKPDPFRAPEVKAILDEVIKLNGYDFRDSNAPTRILNLQFRSPGPKDADLERLRPLLQKSTMPVGLNLNDAGSITDAGLVHLKDIAPLQGLSLGGTRVTIDGLKHLAGMTQLERLYLSDDKITDASLVHLAKLTNLRKLSVYSKGVTAAGYAHLAGLTKLEEFRVGDIGSGLGDEHLAHMKGMTKLKELGIGGDRLTDAGMAHLKNLTELRKLRVDGSKVTAAGVANLAGLTKLESLTVLSCEGFAGEGLAALKDMKALTDVDLIYFAPNAKGIEHLGRVASLKKLRLGSVRNEALAGLANLKNLEEISLFYSGLDDEGLKHVGKLTSLRELSMSNTRISDAGLKHISDLTNLKRLSASDNGGITDAGLQHLAPLVNLEVLWISDCKITGENLKSLSGLTKLKELSINGNPVTDAGIAELKSLKSLKEVNLTGTKTSEDAAIALKKARPDMRIRDLAGDDVVLDPKPKLKRPAVEDITKLKPDLSMTAEEFHKEYKENKNAAAERYKGKVIELSGEVSSVGRNIYDETYVNLKVDKEFLGVMCMMTIDDPWTKVLRGQKVKIKGRFPESSFSAALIYCVFVDAGEYKPITISAVELAKEYADDHEATSKKYKEKYLLVSGEVEDKEFNSVGACGITLKGNDKVKVKLSFTAFEKDLTKKIKIGEKITVVGDYSLNFGGDTVTLLFCLPVKSK